MNTLSYGVKVKNNDEAKILYNLSYRPNKIH